MIEISVCPVCSSDNLKNITHGKSKLLFCKTCSLYFNSEIPSDKELADYYQISYKITATDAYETEMRRISRIPEQIILISEIMNYTPPPSKILDIGADKGFFLDEARRFGYDVKGVEPSSNAQIYSKSCGLDFYSSIDEVNDTFDIAVMWHSLEHFTNPKLIISKIYSLLNDTGYLFIRVPAFDSIYSKILKDKWIWFQPHNHYYHFTHSSLSYLLNYSGFKTLYIQQRKPNNRFTKKAGRLVNSLFSFSFEKHISLKKFLSSAYQNLTAVELFAVARKD